MSTEAFPLHWPEGWPRTKPVARQRAKFGKSKATTHRYSDGTTTSWRSKSELSVAEAIRRVLDELDRLGARGAVISSNVEIRQDGLPYSNRRTPDDPGVAVYFMRGTTRYCLPCDKWDRVADNLAAVAAHVEAMRGMERWGVGSLDRAFAGFKALPPAGGTTVSTQGPSWWNVLGVQPNASRDVVQAAFRALARQHHPDRGGDVGAMAAINRAWEQAQAAMGGAA